MAKAQSRAASTDIPAAASVLEFHEALAAGLDKKDAKKRRWGGAKWGCYAFYDYDGEPIYIGQTFELLSGRVRRHLTNQRTDAVAMRILDVFEVAEVELWPLWQYQEVTRSSARFPKAKKHLDALEFAIYKQAIWDSRFSAVLNEKLPKVMDPLDPLPASTRFRVTRGATEVERTHDDVRIARRAATISRLAAVAYERGDVTTGLRRALVVQAARLTFLSAVRLAKATGNPPPDPKLIDVEGLVVDVFRHPELAQDD
ncbi:GIY-YIG nuclease family protein [Kutzneria sp. NPDC052558]|uniref:GIY-YIG nuclease family protein n=1 Tax=Kutzneria sp. NPDC052558 TaxID=3364121 RepID=UPI0037C700C3